MSALVQCIKEFAILVEDVGRGIPDLINAVFGGTVATDGLVVQLSNLETGLSGAGLFIAVGSLVSGAFFLLIPIAAGIALTVLAAFIVLVLRRIVLLFLIIISPLALILWVLPATQESFKKWWQTYQNLLFMYLLIEVLVAIGAAMAAITATNAGIHEISDFRDVIMTITAILLYFIPYMLIPFAFKWAGGAFANIAGAINDRNRGLIDRMRKSAEQKRADWNTAHLVDVDRNSSVFKRKAAGLSWRKRRPGSVAETRDTIKQGEAIKAMTEGAAFRNSQDVVSAAAEWAGAGGNNSQKAAIARKYGLDLSRPEYNDPDDPLGTWENWGHEEFTGHMLASKINDPRRSRAERSAAMGTLTTQHSKGYDFIRRAQEQAYRVYRGNGSASTRVAARTRFQQAAQANNEELNKKAKDIPSLDWDKYPDINTARQQAVLGLAKDKEDSLAGSDKSTQKLLAEAVTGALASAPPPGTADASQWESIYEMRPELLADRYARQVISLFESSGTPIKKDLAEVHINALVGIGDYMSQQTKEALNATLDKQGYPQDIP